MIHFCIICQTPVGIIFFSFLERNLISKQQNGENCFVYTGIYFTQTTTKLLQRNGIFFSLHQSINRPTLVYICYYANENIFYSYTGGTSFIYSFSHFTPLNLGYSYILFRVAKNFICFNIFLYFSFLFCVFATPIYLYILAFKLEFCSVAVAVVVVFWYLPHSLIYRK